MTGKSSLNSTGAFRDTFFAFGFLWICRTLPSLETKAQCFLHLISLFSVLIFSQVRVDQTRAAMLVILIVVCLQSWQFLIVDVPNFHSGHMLIELLLGQVLLFSLGVRPLDLILWTSAALVLSLWPLDKAFPPVFELASLLTVPMCSLSAQLRAPNSETESESETVEPQMEVTVHHCLKLVLQQLRVPLQLALHEGPEAKGQRLRQIWDLLAGLDQQLEAEFSAGVSKRRRNSWRVQAPGTCIGQSEAEPLSLAAAKAILQRPPAIGTRFEAPEVPDSKAQESMPGSPRSPWSGQRKEGRDAALLEVSTSIGSMVHWEVLPDTVHMELEIDMERDSMPVTEVKFHLPQEERDAVLLKDLFAEEDYENFRNWLEPEVNKAIHGTASGESTSCALRVPLIGGRMNGILAIDEVSNGFRLRCRMSQLSAEKTED